MNAPCDNEPFFAFCPWSALVGTTAESSGLVTFCSIVIMWRQS